MYKLSICIPTYNRAKYLTYLLDSIIKQVDAVNPIEICVSDNASTDNTQELIQQYQKQYPHIVYFRWPENMGPDRNFLQVVAIAHGEYCWLMGSDDAVVVGGVAKVLHAIQQDNVDICMVNTNIYDAHMHPLFQPFILNKKIKNKKFNLYNDDDFMQYANYADSINAFFSYLSVVIFKKQRWDAIKLDETLIGTAYIHVFKLLSFLKDNCWLFYLPDFIILSRANNDTVFSCGGDVAKRQLIDLLGYEKITKSVFPYDPLRRFCILNVIMKSLTLRVKLKIILRSSNYSLATFYAVYQSMFGRSSLFYPFVDKMLVGFKKITLSDRFYATLRAIYRQITKILFKLKRHH